MNNFANLGSAKLDPKASTGQNRQRIMFDEPVFFPARIGTAAVVLSILQHLRCREGGSVYTMY